MAVIFKKGSAGGTTTTGHSKSSVAGGNVSDQVIVAKQLEAVVLGLNAAKEDALSLLVQYNNLCSQEGVVGTRFVSEGPVYIGKTIEVTSQSVCLSMQLELYTLVTGLVVKSDGTVGGQVYTSRKKHSDGTQVPQCHSDDASGVVKVGVNH